MRQILLAAIILFTNSISQSAWTQTSISSEIAPTGKLRVAMNSGIPVLLMRTSDGKITGGVAFETGKLIAEKLGVPFELIAYPSATAYTESFVRENGMLASGHELHWWRKKPISSSLWY